MAASGRIHALIKFEGINRFLVPSNTARFSNSQLSPLKSPFACIHSVSIFEGINRFIVSSNTARFSNSQLSPLKSLFLASSSRRLHSRSIFEDFNNFDDAYDSFHGMIHQQHLPDLFEFNNLLNDVTKMKHYCTCLDMFHVMCDVGVPFDEETLSIVTKCYSRLFETEKVFMLLGFCFKQDIEVTDWTYDKILDGFILGDSTHEAEKFFKKLFKNKLFEPDTTPYITMIKGLCKIGNHFKAIALLRLMDGRGREYDLGAYNPIIDSLCKHMMIDDAFRLFNELMKKRISPTVLSYNSLLYALSMSGRWNEVCRILKQMHDERIIIHRTTFNILIKALCKQGKMKEAEIVDFIMVHNTHYGRNIVTYTSLIDGYCLEGELNRAMSTLESMDRDVVNPTLGIYNRLLDRFISLEDDMKFWSYKRELDSMYGWAGWKIKQNSVTRYIWYRERMEKPCDVPMQNPKYSVYMLCLMDHCDKYEVDAALDLFYFMDGKQLNSNTEVYNILIDGARICERFDKSRRLFHELSVKGLEPNFDTYVLMIRGFCERGLLKDAKKLFLRMEKSGWQPRSIMNDDHIIQEYMETKPIDDLTKLFIETKRGGYNKRVDECFKFVTEYFKPI